MSEKSVRDKILQTSLRLFEQHGYHKVGVNWIIEESETSKGGFYHHFKSKDELLYTIHDAFITFVLNKAKEADRNWSNPVDRIYHLIKSMAMIFELYKSHTTVYYNESNYLSPEYAEKIKVKREEYRDILFNAIDSGIKQGYFFSNLPVNIIGMSIFGMVNWTYKWYRHDGTYSINEISDIYADLILNSIMTEKAKKHFKPSKFFS